MRAVVLIVGLLLSNAALAQQNETQITVKDGNLVNRTYNVIQDGSSPPNYSATAGARNVLSTNDSGLITTGLTYQQMLPQVTDGSRQALDIQNNQASGTDVCYLLYGQNIESQFTIMSGVPYIMGQPVTTLTNITVNGNTMTAGAASKILNPGQAFTRYYPYVPGDPFFITCSTTGDSVQITVQ